MPRITVTEVTTAEERDLAMAIWAAADRTRPRPAGPLRTARVREQLEEGELVLLAHYGPRPAGMALAETYVDPAPHPGIGHISMVRVDPALWGSGVGTAIVRELQRRWPRLSVWIRPDNRRMRRLYAGTGFTDSGNRAELQDGEELVQWLWSR